MLSGPSMWLKGLQREIQARISEATGTIAHLRQDVQEQRDALRAEESEMEALTEVVRDQEATIAGSRYLSPLSEGTNTVDLPVNIGLVERPVT